MSRPFELLRLESRQLLTGTLTPRFVNVPISQAAITADSALANFQTFDLQITINGSNEWLSANLAVNLASGSFYVPSLHDNQAQKGAWSTQANLEFDTFVCGPKFNTASVLGAFQGNSVTINSSTVDIAWGDLLNTKPGTYTIARLTMSNDSSGTLIGNLGQRDNPTFPVDFKSALPLRADGGQIKGSVWNDRDNNGVKDAGEPNLANQHLYIDANNNGQQESNEISVKTRSNGNYTFTGLGPGTHRIRVSPSTGFHTSAPAPNLFWSVKLIKGAAVVGKRFGLTPKVQIKGTVFNDGNNNKAQDPDELGREGFTMFLDSNSDSILDLNEFSTVTDSSGSFAFNGLDAGTYLVRCVNKSGFKRTTSAGVSVDAAAGQVVTGVLFGQKKIS